MASNKANLNGMAGEFMVAGQLLKRGLFASVTMGNAKAIDLLVHNEKTQRVFRVQVKTRADRPTGDGGWILKKFDSGKDSVYVFVILNGPREQEDFFVVKGETLAGNYAQFFGPEFDPAKPGNFDGVSWESVKDDFKDKWEVFSEPV